MGIIAERITKARKELGLNQKELAKKANLTEAYLPRYENGNKRAKVCCTCKACRCPRGKY